MTLQTARLTVESYSRAWALPVISHLSVHIKVQFLTSSDVFFVFLRLPSRLNSEGLADFDPVERPFSSLWPREGNRSVEYYSIQKALPLSLSLSLAHENSLSLPHSHRDVSAQTTQHGLG